MIVAVPLLALAVAATAFAHSAATHHRDFGLVERGKVKAKARQATPVASLFANSTKTYPPLDVSGPTPRPEWVKAFNAAKASSARLLRVSRSDGANEQKAGKIPAIPPSKIVNYNPVYNWKGDPCSFYLTKCNASTDITTGPKNTAGISFDDGPQPASVPLLDFLVKQKVKATHFLIGSRILSNPSVFDKTVASGGQLAVHTWSHPYMTSMTDNGVLGELGWTMQLIFDKSSRIPAFWRPPYGDVDNRVRAIAKEVFGLTTVTWSQDPRDWCLAGSDTTGSVCGPGDGPQSSADLDQELSSFVNKTPLSKGLIILEHSHGARPVAAFEKVFPALKKRWQLKAIADLRSLKWYQ